MRDSLFRIFFAIKEGFRHRILLKSWRVDSRHHIPSVIQLTPALLADLGVRLLVLDFDGVLAPHGELVPLPEVQKWLHTFLEAHSSIAVAILSNKPLKSRQDFFKKEFPSVIFEVSEYKKPYPNGLENLVQKQRVRPSEAALLDDRMLTGMLAAVLSGVSGIYVAKPYMDFRKRPVAESFFWCLRALERLVL